MLEKLIETLAALVVALNDNTAAVKAGGGPAPKKEKKEKEPEKQPDVPAGPTLQEFRDLAAKIVDANEGAQIETLCKKHGLARVSAAHGTDKAQLVYDELKAINAKL